MPKEVKSPTKMLKHPSVKRITKDQTEASRIESFLKRGGFKLITDRDKARLKKLGIIGIPSE